MYKVPPSKEWLLRAAELEDEFEEFDDEKDYEHYWSDLTIDEFHKKYNT